MVLAKRVFKESLVKRFLQKESSIKGLPKRIF